MRSFYIYIFHEESESECDCDVKQPISLSLTFLMENMYVQFDGIVYHQIVGIPMGTYCAPLI